MTKKRILVLYHCGRDGVAAAALLENAALNTYEYNDLCINEYSLDYSFPLEDLYDPEEISASYDEVYILDYVLRNKDAIWLDLIDRSVRVIWIDHHEESWNILHMDDEIHNTSLTPFIAQGVSTSALTWIYCNDNREKIITQINNNLNTHNFIKPKVILNILMDNYCPLIILMTHRYAIGDFDVSTAEGINILYWSYACCHGIDWWINLFHIRTVDEAEQIVYRETYRGRDMFDDRNTYNNEYCDRYGFETMLTIGKRKMKVFAINKTTSNIYSFGNRIDKYNLCVRFNYDHNTKQWSYSLYSSRLDVSQIASRYHGGGEQHAAGFYSRRMLLDNPVIAITETYDGDQISYPNMKQMVFANAIQ